MSMGIMGLRRSDILMASFPRSGSTWIRYVLCNMISVQELKGQEVDFHFLDQMMPSLGQNNLLRAWRFKTLPRFVKTHQPYRPIFFSMPKRYLHILRDPRDVAVSYYSYLCKLKINPFEGTFAEFIRHPRYGFESQIKHFNSWNSHSAYMLRYEILKRDPINEFKKSLESLSIAIEDEILFEAIERSTFENMRSVETKSGVYNSQRFDSTFRTVRRGKSGQWQDMLTKHDLAYYTQLCEKYDFHLYD